MRELPTYTREITKVESADTGRLKISFKAIATSAGTIRNVVYPKSYLQALSNEQRQEITELKPGDRIELSVNVVNSRAEVKVLKRIRDAQGSSN